MNDRAKIIKIIINKNDLIGDAFFFLTEIDLLKLRVIIVLSSLFVLFTMFNDDRISEKKKLYSLYFIFIVIRLLKYFHCLKKNFFSLIYIYYVCFFYNLHIA
jgi:hypothetical protein